MNFRTRPNDRDPAGQPSSTLAWVREEKTLVAEGTPGSPEYSGVKLPLIQMVDGPRGKHRPGRRVSNSVTGVRLGFPGAEPDLKTRHIFFSPSGTGPDK